MGEEVRAGMEVRTAQVHLDGDDVVGCAAERDGRLLVLLDRAPPEADDDPSTRVVQLGKIVLQPRADAWSLQADAVEHRLTGFVQSRRRITRPRLGGQRLDHDCTQSIEGEVRLQLRAVPARSRRRHDRVRQLDRPDVRREIHSGSSNWSVSASWYSCSVRTRRSWRAQSAMPSAAATPAAAVVRQGMACCSAAARM